MFFSHYLQQLAQRWSLRSGKRRRIGRVPARIRPRVRPRLEVLEDRLTPSGYSVTDVGSPPNGFNRMSSVPSNVNNSGQFADIGYNAQYQYHVLLYSKGQWTDLGQPNSDFNEASLYINNSGQIVAYSLVNSQAHTFLYGNGQWTDLGLPNGVTSMEPSGINDSGQVIATGFASNGSAGGSFLYSNGQWTDLGVPSGFTSAEVWGINNSGQIVGSAYNSAAEQSDVVLYSNGQWTDLGEPSGYPEGGFVFINNSGQIVADAGTAGSTAGETHAFLYSNGQWTDLGTPDGLPYATAYSINNSGQIAGMAFIVSLQNSQEAAFLYSNGQMIDLNSLLPAGSSDTLTAAYSINDNGQIVAGGSNGSSAQDYLLTPQQNTGVSISNGTVSPATLTASSSGQQVTVSATINDNGSPATIGNVVFSLIGSNGTLVSDGPTGVLIGANGQASDTLTVPGGAAAGAYSLSVAYTNNGQNTTQAFTGALTISTASPAPVITANPSNQSVKVGQTATFTASASGSPTPTVQWQLSSDGGKTWTNVNLPSSNTITVPNVTLAQNGLEVRAVFTNSAGSETTSAATLTVTASSPSPTPPSQPAPTPAPSSPSIPDQIGQLVQDVVLMEQSLMSGDLAAFGQEMQDYVSLFVTVEMEIVQTVLNDLA